MKARSRELTSQPSPPNERARSRLPGLDAVRALATVLVIVIHADHWPLQDAGADRALWSRVDIVARVAVPLFVMLSGVLLTYRTDGEGVRGSFVRRRLRRSVLPWLVWAPVYVLIGMYLTGEVPRSLSGAGRWLLAGGGHLYFLILIPQLYAVFLIWPRSPRGTTIAAICALALQTGLSVYRLYAPASAPLNSVFLAFAYELFFFWAGYFALGAALGTHIGRGRRWPAWPCWLAVPAGAAILLSIDLSRAPNGSFAQGTGAFLNPALPLLTVPLFLAVAVSAESWLASRPGLRLIVEALSRYSLGIYIVHEALMYIPGLLLQPLLLQRHLPASLFGFVLLLLLTLLLALAATRLLVATPLAVTLGSPRYPLHRSR